MLRDWNPKPESVQKGNPIPPDITVQESVWPSSISEFLDINMEKVWPYKVQNNGQGEEIREVINSAYHFILLTPYT